MRREIVINADDFGGHESINAAIELAARAGILSAASLMIGGGAADDAIARAARLPQLRVGLHLTLIDGISTLPHSSIPLLVDARGYFRDDMLRYALQAFTDRNVRAQLRAEIQAQFDAFVATGLTLDHVNTHKHFHMHPTIFDMILEVGAGYGMKAMRIPDEPLPYVWQQGSAPAALGNAALKPLLARMRRRLAERRIGHCDRVFGVHWSGAMTKARLLSIVASLPAGSSEIYLHPALESGTDISPRMVGYQNAAELEALLSPEVASALAANGLKPRGYADLGT